MEPKPAVLGSTWNSSESSVHFKQCFPMACCPALKWEDRSSIFERPFDIPGFQSTRTTRSLSGSNAKCWCQRSSPRSDEGWTESWRDERSSPRWTVRWDPGFFIWLVCFPVSCWWFGSFFSLPMKVRRAFSWKLGVSIIAFISPKGSTSRPGTQVAKMADEQKMETKNKAQVLRCEAVKTPKVLKMSQKVFTILLMETTYCTFALEFANCIIAAFWAWCGQSCR